ncbi:hypothetical protein ABW20_dc0104238 [Dactylellina cionopaga]|nr:hypothetical protein ABW20_dc0104238 [Dactylellina cionopaga]
MSESVISSTTAVSSDKLLTPPPLFESPELRGVHISSIRSPSPFFIPPARSPSNQSSGLMSQNFRHSGYLEEYEDIEDNGYIPRSPSSTESSGIISQVHPDRLHRLQNLNTDLPLLRSPNVRQSSRQRRQLLTELYSGPNNSDFPISRSPEDDQSLGLSSQSSSPDCANSPGQTCHDTSPIPPPRLDSPDPTRKPQIGWEEMRQKMKHAYQNQLDNGLLDCLLVQDSKDYIFFDLKYTHIGDYLEVGFARTPVQICIMNFSGTILYQANLAMFDPRNGREIVCMHQWVSLISDYQTTGAMSRRWYNEERLKDAIFNMRGYFWSQNIPRRTIWQIKSDLSGFNFRHNILFTHDGNLRTYDLLRKLLPEATMPPRLLTMSSLKMIKMILPDMPRDLYKFYYHVVDLKTFADPTSPVLHKYIATDDTTYVRQIFTFFIRAWEVSQSEEGGRSLDDAPDRLVDVWEGFPPDSPIFEPVSDSDDEDDAGMSLSEVEALELEMERREEARRIGGDGDDAEAGALVGIEDLSISNAGAKADAATNTEDSNTAEAEVEANLPS